MSQRVELLAPAGNPEGFYGAIHAGADAVYLAGSRFGARAYADNFTTEELISCIRYAHIWGRKIYLTVNTLVKEAELEELHPYLAPFYEAGLDGVIVQDIGVFQYIKKHFPEMELHVSTQMTLTGVYGARLLKKMGAVRIVPARELSLEELTAIKEETGLAIETFIHGAMCYCYSGQCLFSSILGGRSGNRGRCAQPCRLPYREGDKKTAEERYPLSLKDMCTIEHIPQLLAAGIDSFKIEGRMKKPEYAAGVTAIYRKYIDKYYAGEDCQVSRRDLEHLSKLYIRSQQQDGYYYRHNGRDMVTLHNPSYSGTDEKLLLSIRERFLEKRPKIAIRITAVFRAGQTAFLRFGLMKHPDWEATVYGETVASAVKQPITEENIRKQLGKLGDTVFEADEIDIIMEDNVFYPLKALNDLRRRATVLLENTIMDKQGLCSGRIVPANTAEHVMTGCNMLEKSCTDADEKRNMHLSIQSAEQLKAFVSVLDGLIKDCHYVPERIYLDGDCIYKAECALDEAFFDMCRRLRQHGCRLLIALPAILRRRDERYLSLLWDVYMRNRSLFFGFQVRSMEGMGFLEQKGCGCHGDEAIYADAGFYIWNRESVRAFLPDSGVDETLCVRLDGFCMPYELKNAEQRKLYGAVSRQLRVEKIVYGRIPLMLTANCVVNTLYGCKPGEGSRLCYLTDRYKKKFPVLRNCIHCMNVIYNSLPLSLHGELKKWNDKTEFRVDFTIEDEQETRQILQYFLSGAKGEPPFLEYTTGHEKRGVE